MAAGRGATHHPPLTTDAVSNFDPCVRAAVLAALAAEGVPASAYVLKYGDKFNGCGEVAVGIPTNPAILYPRRVFIKAFLNISAATYNAVRACAPLGGGHLLPLAGAHHQPRCAHTPACGCSSHRCSLCCPLLPPPPAAARPVWRLPGVELRQVVLPALRLQHQLGGHDHLAQAHADGEPPACLPVLLQPAAASDCLQQPAVPPTVPA